MLDLANKNQLNALSKLVLNVMKRSVPIQPKTIQKLKRYKNVLQELSNMTLIILSPGTFAISGKQTIK